MTINCWVIDDEPAAHKGLELALQNHSDFSVVYHGYNVDEPAALSLPKPDVVFLDIEMPRQNGFALLKLWNEPLPHIVFITAYGQYAVAAFDNNALDYLLKPIEQERFNIMINKVRQHIKQQTLVLKRARVEAFYEQLKLQTSQLGLSVKTSEGLFYIKQKDILYIEAVADHLALHFADKAMLSRDSFKRLSLELDDKFFARSHKSYMINLAHVRKVEKGRFGDALLLMSNGESVKMSRRYKALLVQLNKVNNNAAT
ncbi:Transcriptional regulatory protein BtsR [Pseudoalteromonas sp. CIP111854]|uniref:Transcriptional regulatory protein BtsR n=1 Tax=Pseudoalteromonas holothuriae TaxID=2963714 RepID=A0A9W4QU05_9GAMM|nr:LytTR family transcriptional regulator DNA-binding domain-containing protein [Pseudoalteromonas sp. CIP111854]CAH9052707.1 Transcriptional regulatory protein BtsR [Pseudoalteromonas sp. CIP111854]